MLRSMSNEVVRICPPQLHREALELVLGGVSPEQRGSVIDALRPIAEQGVDVFASLAISIKDNAITGATWLQPQVGRTATLWPPQLATGANPQIVQRLTAAAIEAGWTLPVDLVQALLEDPNDPFTTTLTQLGFDHLADLRYLALKIPTAVPSVADEELQLQSPAAGHPDILRAVIADSYNATLDCPGLEGRRQMDDVLAGYASVGVHDPALWFIVEWRGEPAGVLLLAPYPEANQWELTYMGVTPKFRGQGLGRRILARLVLLASAAGIAHIVLAVDSQNWPALKMYEQANFVGWARRTAYIKQLVLKNAASLRVAP